MKLHLGFSPCPNDTFIFDALVNGKIDTGNYRFEVVLEDVQTLNQWALAGKLDISKISYGVWPLVTNKYTLLDSGGALGMGVGPLLITRNPLHSPDEVNNMRIAIPGINTTAHLLFSMAFPEATNKSFHVFHEIEALVLSGEADAGVIIHENRFTYQDKGLHLLFDLGKYWEEQTQVPIPLGGIVARQDLPASVASDVNRLIGESIRYAFAQYPDLSDYIRAHSQEMSEDVMRKHINLYVNDYSLNLGPSGKKAIQTLVNIYDQVNSD